MQRRVRASASHIFSLVADPNMHVAIDGSGMLMAAPDSTPVTAVGDTFVMNMDREPLGDIPMGKYQVRNTVTTFEPNSELAWTIGGVDSDPLGHIYGYSLSPVGDNETDITLYCDWSGFSPERKDKLTWPVVPVHMLEATLVKLDALATS